MRRFAAIFVSVLCAALLVAHSFPFAFSVDSGARIAQKISIPGIPNAGKVGAHLYRGAQPALNHLGELKKLGVTTIIDLRAESSHTAAREQKRAESLGMRFLRVPIGAFSTPTDDELLRFFQILGNSPGETFFVHCEFGRDRTGVMIAAYRIAFENWSADYALLEMNSFGFNRLWHPSMITYVQTLPTRIQFDPVLKNAVERDPATP